jgi:uncharacterized RDD family membrane protein YckC
MKTKSNALWAGILLAALTPFALGAFQAQPAKPDAEPTPTPALREAGASPAPAAAPAPEAALHEISANDTAAAPTPTAAPAEKDRHRRHYDDNKVSVGDSTYVGPDESVDGNAVAVMGTLAVDGSVSGNAVSVMGSSTINGTVNGNAVAVLGDLTLGPKARLDGNAVSIGGRVHKDPSAFIGGNVIEPAPRLSFSDNGTASSWWEHGLRMGRPLAIGPHLHLFWLFSVFTIALYLCLALLFPGGVRKCADTLEQRPGITFLTGFLAMLGLPVLFVLLCVTVVGIPVAVVVLPLTIMGCIIFGRTALYSFVGRLIVGRKVHPVIAVLVGVALFVILYLVPVLGLMIWFLVTFLGFACALTTLFTSTKSAPPAAAPPSGIPPAAPAQPVPAPAGIAAPAAAPESPAAAAPLSAEAPPVVSAPVAPVPPPVSPALETGHPRAGFWIRMVALLIDLILIGIIFRSGAVILPALAAYGAVLWKLKGATVGGIIFGLKVVRHDGRPMDWTTAVVRALACFLSLVFLCLGFIWIAFDAEKQAWHDKIAGTVVVRLPRGISLV